MSVRNDVKLRCGSGVAKTRLGDNSYSYPNSSLLSSLSFHPYLSPLLSLVSPLPLNPIMPKTRARTRAQARALENEESTNPKENDQQAAPPVDTQVFPNHEGAARARVAVPKAKGPSKTKANAKSKKKAAGPSHSLEENDDRRSPIAHSETLPTDMAPPVETQALLSQEQTKKKLPPKTKRNNSESQAKGSGTGKKRKAAVLNDHPDEMVGRPSNFPSKTLPTNLALKVPPPRTKEVDLNTEGVAVLRTFLTTRMTLPEAQAALDSLFGRQVSEEQPWYSLLSKITSVEDEEGIAAVQAELDSAFTNVTEFPPTTDDLFGGSPLTPIPASSSPVHRQKRLTAEKVVLSGETPSKSKPMPASSSLIHSQRHPSVEKTVKFASGPTRNRVGQSPSATTNPARLQRVPISTYNLPEELPFDPEEDLFDFECDEFADEDKEILELVNNDINQDLDWYFPAAFHDKARADSVWHQLNDGLFDAAQAVASEDKLSRSTAVAELRAMVRLGDIGEYEMLRDTARVEWADIESDGCEDTQTRPASRNSLFEGSDDDVASDEHRRDFSTALVDYPSSSYDPDDFEHNNEEPFGNVADNDPVDERFLDDDEEREEDNKGSEDSDVNEEEEEEEDGSKRPGRLPQAVKEELSALQEEYEKKVAAVAAKAKKNVHACWRYLNENISTPRNLTAWNAYQAWYAEKGDKKRPEKMLQSVWNAQVAKTYSDIVNENLKPGDRKNEELLLKLFAEQVEWYEAQLDAFREKKNAEGKRAVNVQKLLQPIYGMGKKIFKETGAHLLGHLIVTDHGARGKTQSVIRDHSVDLRTQLTDIESLIRGKEMNNRGVDKKLAELAVTCSTKVTDKTIRDRNRRAIPAIFTYDTDRVAGTKTPKLAPAQFAEYAYQYHVRVINWPVGVPFFSAGGVANTHKMTCPDLRKVAVPRIAQIFQDADFEVRESDKLEIEQAVNQKCFEIVSWEDDEIEMALEDQARIPIVQDTNGDIILTVSYSTEYQKEFGDETHVVVGDGDDKGESEHSDISQAASLYHEDTPPRTHVTSRPISKPAAAPNRWYQGQSMLQGDGRDSIPNNPRHRVSHSLDTRPRGNAEASINNRLRQSQHYPQQSQSDSTSRMNRHQPKRLNSEVFPPRSSTTVPSTTSSTGHRQPSRLAVVHETRERRFAETSRVGSKQGLAQGVKRKAISSDLATPVAKRMKTDERSRVVAGHRNR
ncbi:hypothetical protein EV360DRAFT_72904 [Lentinula raphanica]|nr:hypothetical protein EV360DRAFT_72904 [Lentinula raphanica]